MTVAEVDQTKFLYMHQIDFSPWKWIKLGILEGNLVNEPFEIRFLNPLMIMHSFASWTDYRDSLEKKYYGEGHVCAYMGIKFDYPKPYTLIEFLLSTVEGIHLHTYYQ